jgi:hypothetical protein
VKEEIASVAKGAGLQDVREGNSRIIGISFCALNEWGTDGQANIWQCTRLPR